MVRTIGASKLIRRSTRRAINSTNQQGQDTPPQDGARSQGTGVDRMRRRRKCRSYLLAGAVVVVGAYTLKLFSGSLQPLRVRVAKSGLVFKDWCRANIGVAREDFQDVVAEARQDYEKDSNGKVVHFNKELELGEKLDGHLEKLEKELEEKKKSAVSKRNTKKRKSAK